MASTKKPTVYHIPVCPFSQRLEILLELKGLRDAVLFQVVDITKPRSPELLRKPRGSTALPVLETEDGRILKRRASSSCATWRTASPSRRWPRPIPTPAP